MASLEVFGAGHGVGFYPGTGTVTTLSFPTYGSLAWQPLFVTTQPAWSSGTAYAASTDEKVGAQVVAVSNTYVCWVKGSGNSTVNPSSGTGGTTTPGTLTNSGTPLADGYIWFCIGNSTADFTTLASANQAVSQIILDNRASQAFGDTMIELGVSLATGVSGAAGLYITALIQWLNPDGSTYADGLGGGSNISAPQDTQRNILFPSGRSTPIVGRTGWLPASNLVGRAALINGIGGALSSSTHVVSFRTGVFNLNG